MRLMKTEILKNKELISINQDSACLQAYVAKEVKDKDGNLIGEVWIKNLGSDNSNEKAVAFFNRSGTDVNFKIDLEDIGLSGNVLSVKDLWEHEDTTFDEIINVSVKSHCTKIFRIKKYISRK